MNKIKDTLTEHERRYLILILKEKEASLNCLLYTSNENLQSHIYSGIKLIDSMLNKLEDVV